MNPYANPTAGKQWYHVVCTMYRSRAMLKIPATARCCERAIAEECSFPGWTVDIVAVSPTQMRILIRTTPRLTREAVIGAVKHAAAAAVRRSGAIPPGHPVWGEKAWCFALRNDAAVATVRQHLAPYSKTGPINANAPASVRWPDAVAERLRRPGSVR